uniref:Transcription factor 25 n=1 Tax=Aotus nancymaae TaxID=37293 RepID=A0A2K5E0R8_AOTNA
MSRRALRRLRGEQHGQDPLGPGALQFDLRDDDDAEEEGPKRELGSQRPGEAGKEGVRVNNRFELINIEDLEDDSVVNGERSGSSLTDTAAPGNKGRADGGVARTAPPEQSNASGKLRKKKKKQKTKKSSTGEALENGLEDIDRILERIEDSSGLNRPGPAALSPRKHVLYVEHRHLNPDTELKRYFGARAVLGEQRPRQRQRMYPKCTWLMTPKSTWPRYSKPGLSMRLLESKKGLSLFAFEHSEAYQQAQHKFLAAYCKLILSLEPDEDPLCMLLLIDHLALRARNYECKYLIRLFQEWEAHRNLLQLPNFAFSVPLAYFLLSQQTDLPEHEQSSAREKASLLIQQVLTMFPGVLLPLLEYCSVRPDATVSTHRFFGPNAEISQPPALSQLVSLYLGRSHFLWKEPATMSWLEESVHRVLQAVDAGDPAVEACEHRWKVLYQCAPRNIHRYVILSEIKEAVAALPPDVTMQSVMGFDPLPPADTIYSYVRPERLSPVSHENTIALFFWSLLPNYTIEGERPEEGVAGGLNPNQGLNRLMLAVRDMMANFHLNDVEAPHEDDPEGEGEWD